MSPKTKLKKPNEEESDDSCSSDSSTNNDDSYSGNEVIQVDFEGRNPMTSDFHGIRQLLQQLFLKSDINLSELADIVIDQNFIGSVVIQSFLGDDDDNDDSDDDENFDSETIFGITSAINISKSYSTGCIESMRNYLLTKCDQFAKSSDKEIFEQILNDDAKQIVLVINERFINIPAQISVPLLENLNNEIQCAAVKKEKFKFTHFIMIVKLSRKKGSGKSADATYDIYSNGEEEVLNEYADAQFEYSAESETDTTLSGNWTEKDSTLIPYRRVVIFEAGKFPLLINAIKELIN